MARPSYFIDYSINFEIRRTAVLTNSTDGMNGRMVMSCHHSRGRGTAWTDGIISMDVSTYSDYLLEVGTYVSLSRSWRLVLCKAKIDSGTGGLLFNQQYAYGWDEGIGWMDGDAVPTSGKCRGNGGMDGWMFVCMYLDIRCSSMMLSISISISKISEVVVARCWLLVSTPN